MSFGVTLGSIDIAALRSVAEDPASGAFVLFEGWVRNHHEGRAVLRLEYEAYAPLVTKEGERILCEAREAYAIHRAHAIHRTGLVEIGDTAVAVAVSAAHRDEAFSACRYIIDQAKLRLPIWKKEYFSDGSAEWVNCARCAAHGHAGRRHEHA